MHGRRSSGMMGQEHHQLDLLHLLGDSGLELHINVPRGYLADVVGPLDPERTIGRRPRS